MSDKPAPAPWVWEGDKLIAADRKPVIDAIPYEGQWIDPDSPEGRLIASAPDMLAALTRLVETAKPACPAGVAAFEDARAAIAKATGA